MYKVYAFLLQISLNFQNFVNVFRLVRLGDLGDKIDLEILKRSL